MDENLFIFSNLNRKIVFYAFQILPEIPTKIDFDYQAEKNCADKIRRTKLGQLGRTPNSMTRKPLEHILFEQICS